MMQDYAYVYCGTAVQLQAERFFKGGGLAAGRGHRLTASQRDHQISGWAGLYFLDPFQIDDLRPAGTEKNRGIEPRFERRQRPGDQRALILETQARVIAFGFEQINVGNAD